MLKSFFPRTVSHSTLLIASPTARLNVKDTITSTEVTRRSAGSSSPTLASLLLDGNYLHLSLLFQSRFSISSTLQRRYFDLSLILDPVSLRRLTTVFFPSLRSERSSLDLPRSAITTFDITWSTVLRTLMDLKTLLSRGTSAVAVSVSIN